MSTHHHNHNQEEASWGKRLLISMVMNLIIPVIQIAGGIVSGSMALISDALHNLIDFVSLVINYGALVIGKRVPTYKHTFGYKRVEVLATVISVACSMEPVFISLSRHGNDCESHSRLPASLSFGLRFWALWAI